MDKKTLEVLNRLKEILFTISLEGFAGNRFKISYKQNRSLRNLMENLSDTLYEKCILNYETRKKMHKEIRILLKEEAGN